MTSLLQRLSFLKNIKFFQKILTNKLKIAGLGLSSFALWKSRDIIKMKYLEMKGCYYDNIKIDIGNIPVSGKTFLKNTKYQYFICYNFNKDDKYTEITTMPDVYKKDAVINFYDTKDIKNHENWFCNSIDIIRPTDNSQVYIRKNYYSTNEYKVLYHISVVDLATHGLYPMIEYKDEKNLLEKMLNGEIIKKVEKEVENKTIPVDRLKYLLDLRPDLYTQLDKTSILGDDELKYSISYAKELNCHLK